MEKPLDENRKEEPYLIYGRKNESYLVSVLLIPVSYFLIPLTLLRHLFSSIFEMIWTTLDILFIHGIKIPYHCLKGNVDTLPRTITHIVKSIEKKD